MDDPYNDNAPPWDTSSFEAFLQSFEARWSYGFGQAMQPLQHLGAAIGNAVQNFFVWLISVAVGLVSWLPNHTPRDWPDPATWAVAFRGIGIIGRFVDLPVMFASMAFVIGWTVIVLVYAAYRAVLGLIPTFK